MFTTVVDIISDVANLLLSKYILMDASFAKTLLKYSELQIIILFMKLKILKRNGVWTKYGNENVTHIL